MGRKLKLLENGAASFQCPSRPSRRPARNPTSDSIRHVRLIGPAEVCATPKRMSRPESKTSIDHCLPLSSVFCLRKPLTGSAWQAQSTTSTAPLPTTTAPQLRPVPPNHRRSSVKVVLQMTNWGVNSLRWRWGNKAVSMLTAARSDGLIYVLTPVVPLEVTALLRCSLQL